MCVLSIKLNTEFLSAKINDEFEFRLKRRVARLKDSA